ncbi:hypothetical protein DFH06DRAFT_1209591 [Mycena polygramma]|nr:hypothetical protein DFH06DRAFT_1209591 [Mycena polygramma]
MATESDDIPPDLIRPLQVASYVFAGATAVIIWDILHHLKDDYSILFKHKFQISAVAYVLSRLASLTYVLGFTIFATYPLRDCKTAVHAFNGFLPISVGSTGLLFFFRLRAIYNGQPLITRCFAFLWLCMLAASLTVPFGTTAAKIGAACIVTQIPSYQVANGITMTVYDTSVFLAISYRLLENSDVEHTPGERVHALFRGPHLHTFSRALFRDGQKYYLITVITNGMTIAMVYSSRINPIYRGMLSIPNNAVINIMVCRVYRNVRLHYLHPRTPIISLPIADDSGIGRFTVPRNTDPETFRLEERSGTREYSTTKQDLSQERHMEREGEGEGKLTTNVTCTPVNSW